MPLNLWSSRSVIRILALCGRRLEMQGSGTVSSSEVLSLQAHIRSGGIIVVDTQLQVNVQPGIGSMACTCMG